MTRCGLYFGGRTIRFTGLDVTGEGNHGIKGDFWAIWLSSCVVVSLTERKRKTEEEQVGEAVCKSRALLWTGPHLNTTEVLKMTPRVILFSPFYR